MFGREVNAVLDCQLYKVLCYLNRVFPERSQGYRPHIHIPSNINMILKTQQPIITRTPRLSRLITTSLHRSLKLRIRRLGRAPKPRYRALASGRVAVLPRRFATRYVDGGFHLSVPA